MEQLIIEGGQKLHGRVKISGSKNAALAILAAAIMTKERVKLHNLPNITDVRVLIAILEDLGASIRRRGRNSIELRSPGLRSYSPPYDMVKKLRASYYLMGSLLARFGRAEVPIPGGCDFGPRPIDQHLKGFSALGTDIEIEHGLVKLRAEKLKAAHIYLDVVSVGATINLMLAATAAEGQTTIENASKEPEIVDAANFLSAMGASIKGAGTDVIRIKGGRPLFSANHTIIPDRIEAGSFMIAAVATDGEIVIEEVIPKHLEAVAAKLREAGAEIELQADRVRVKRGPQLLPVDIKTFVYPGFPTDLQPLAMTLLTAAEGTSVITENVFESRFHHVDELKRMGAQIKVEGRTAIIEGGPPLTGAPVKATDLRAGAAMLVGGFMGQGRTILSGVGQIYRGYEDIEAKLTRLGARLKRIRSSFPALPGESS
ncbi:MAG: UDP-N-acetylglucosamine 1-carboxyvinyltransferase [Firmicutes bacterium]|nr:UDP-N-acetylglucosamine 1-carboxyvinyltransferase [Bacillota bacterium]